MNWIEILRIYGGNSYPLSNGWGDGILVGAWQFEGKIKVLVAWPNGDNPKQLFTEDWKKPA